ncbi:MAG: RsmE family RNA methyltransferase [Bacteroidota bacterium]
MEIFYSEFNKNNDTINVNDIDSKHIVKSLRKKIGDEISFTNGNGLSCKTKIKEIGKKVKVEIISFKKEALSNEKIHIAISPLKNSSRFEWFLEKATEIGVREITPVITRYSEKKKINFVRAERIIISSMKQSYQLYKPKINSTINFSDFLKQNKDFKIMANLKTTRLIKANDIKSNNICLMIGPEGGFSDEEIIKARSNNILEISLGKNRLRSETAAVYSLSIIKTLLSL